MDRNLKPLFAVACIAVVTAVGYFSWAEWSEARAAASARTATAEQAMTDREMMESELRRSLSAAPEQAETLPEFCGLLRIGRAELRGSTLAQVDTARRLTGYCASLGI